MSNSPGGAPLAFLLRSHRHGAFPPCRDADGQPLVYVYGRDDQGVKNYMLATDEARRIALNIARLPELLGAGVGNSR